jgi:hypothetical protein
MNKSSARIVCKQLASQSELLISILLLPIDHFTLPLTLFRTARRLFHCFIIAKIAYSAYETLKVVDVLGECAKCALGDFPDKLGKMER